MAPIDDIPDNYSQEQMVGLGIFFTIVPIVAVGLRLWAKRLGDRGPLKLDDYFIILGMLISCACSGLMIAAATVGYLGQHQSQTPEGGPNLKDPKFIWYEKLKFPMNLLSCVGLGFIKASILILYLNIFVGRYFRIIAKVLLGVCFCWSVVFFFTNLFLCNPVTVFIEPPYGHDCLDATTLWISMAISDPIIDVAILILPTPMVLKLQLPLRQRLGVLSMFLLGATVIAFSIMRAIMYFHVIRNWAHFNDLTYYTTPSFSWLVIEQATAVASACLPTYRPLWVFFRGHGFLHPSLYGTDHKYGGRNGSGGSRSSGFRKPSRSSRSRSFSDDAGIWKTVAYAVSKSTPGGKARLAESRTEPDEEDIGLTSLGVGANPNAFGYSHAQVSAGGIGARTPDSQPRTPNGEFPEIRVFPPPPVYRA